MGFVELNVKNDNLEKTGQPKLVRYIKWHRGHVKIGTWNVRYLCEKGEEIVGEMITYHLRPYRRDYIKEEV